MSQNSHLDPIDDLESDGPLELELESEDSGKGVNWMIVVGLIVAAIGVTFIVLDGFESETYFYTVDQAVAKGTDIVGETVRVKGIVEPGTIIGEDGELRRTFKVTENGKSLTVTYDKAMPDTFDENMEVVVQGEVQKDLSINADEVLVKCPSRYEGAPPTGQTAAPQAAL